MGLVVWLPLNGNLENYGTSAAAITNNGATVNNNGKIGKCYSFDGSDDYISIADTKVFDLFKGGTTPFSITMWVYHADSTRGILFGDYGLSGAINFNIELYEAHQLRFYWNGSPDFSPMSTSIGLATWGHLAVTYDGTQVKLYKNGTVIEETRNVTLAARNKTTGEFRLGRDSRSGSTAFNGRMNDVRIYDHCLSAAEVHEISQGLVLHYKLDSGYNESTTNLCGTSTGGWNNSGTCTRTVNDTAIPGKPTTSNTYSVRATSDGSMALTCGTTTASHPSKTIIASVYVWLDGTQDSSSFYLRSTKTDGSVGNLMYNGNANPSTWPQQQWIRINTNAINTASDATTFYICTYVNKNTEVRAVNGWQIEVKDHVTPYTAPGTTRTDITVYDSSGYNHNGTINGTLSISSDTPRYSTCSIFNGSNTRINVPNLTPAELTISFWMKRGANTGTRQFMYTAWSGITCELQTNGTPTFAVNRSSYPTITGTAITTDNGWVHYCATFDTTNGSKLYQNGVLKSSNSNVTPIVYSISTNYIGYYNTYYNGKMSDFRMYCTALSAADVKQLYEMGAKVDNKGSWHTYEYIDNATKETVTKTGKTMGHTIIEPYLPLYDKTIYTEPDGSTWIHIFHHNNPANSKFDSPTTDWLLGKYIDADRWYDVDQAIYNSLSPYEFMVKQKTTSSATETKYRWKQTANPLTATWADVKPGTPTFITTSGYSNNSKGGLYIFKTSNLHMCIANGNNGNWYGGIGCATAYNGGIPGYPDTTVTNGYIDLYMRVYNGAKVIKDIGINANNLIEF